MELLELSDEDRARSTKDEIFAFDRTISRLLEMQSSSYVEAWRADYYPSEGSAGIKRDFPKLCDADGDVLVALASMPDDDLRKIYANYNWGRLNDSEEDGILGEAIEVLLGDVAEARAASPLRPEEPGAAAITRGKKYSFDEFLRLVRNK